MPDEYDEIAIEYVSVEKIKVTAGNPRKRTSKQLKGLDRAIDDIGVTSPINIDEDDNLITGEGRLEILKRRGHNLFRA